ncbi:MAG TPA: type II toxin-antitoxin system VapC family toxin [Thermoanaerobaculia bacterium]|nr:type II toxin-antitoxin system VapC family toxin [Thermoanaerobaculia bacterium]
MKFLIDTHCWLWAFVARERLNDKALALIASDENTIVFSAVSVAEIAVKARIGKLTFPSSAKEYVEAGIESSRVKTLPLYINHALRVAELPLHHRDPFDCLLIAQAQTEGVPLMTADATIAKYDVDIIWAGREEAPPRQVQ